MTEGLEPIARRVRCQGVEQRDDKLLRHRRQRHVAVLLAESFEEGPTFRGRATGETAEGLRAVVFGNGGGDAARLAALAGTDRDRRGGERLLIGLHELGGADNAGKRNARRATTAEVVISTEALHVFQMQFGHLAPSPSASPLASRSRRPTGFPPTSAELPALVTIVIFPPGSTTYWANQCRPSSPVWLYSTASACAGCIVSSPPSVVTACQSSHSNRVSDRHQW